MLLKLGLAHPHLVEGAQRRQDGAAWGCIVWIACVQSEHSGKRWHSASRRACKAGSGAGCSRQLAARSARRRAPIHAAKRFSVGLTGAMTLTRVPPGASSVRSRSRRSRALVSSEVPPGCFECGVNTGYERIMMTHLSAWSTCMQLKLQRSLLGLKTASASAQGCSNSLSWPHP